MTRQSLWPSYVHSDNEQKKESIRTKNVNNYQIHKPSEKKGELVLAIARFVIKNNRIDKKKISTELGVCISAVEKALKKIKEKLSSGHALPGLSNAEEEMLLKIMLQKDETQRDGQKERNIITGIMREHVVSRMFSGDAGVAEISKLVGLKRQDVRDIIERIKGCSMEDLARDMYRESIGINVIAAKLGMSKKDVKKALPRVIPAPKTCKTFIPEVRRISTIKPGNIKNQRSLKKRPASISRTGLAAWCMQHYDKNGRLILPYGCTAPSDLPRKYPEIKVNIGRAEPKESYFPAPPPSRAEGTARGRRRIGYLHLG